MQSGKKAQLSPRMNSQWPSSIRYSESLAMIQAHRLDLLSPLISYLRVKTCSSLESLTLKERALLEFMHARDIRRSRRAPLWSWSSSPTEATKSEARREESTKPASVTTLKHNGKKTFKKRWKLKIHLFHSKGLHLTFTNDKRKKWQDKLSSTHFTFVRRLGRGSRKHSNLGAAGAIRPVARAEGPLPKAHHC